MNDHKFNSINNILYGTLRIAQQNNYSSSLRFVTTSSTLLTHILILVRQREYFQRMIWMNSWVILHGQSDLEFAQAILFMARFVVALVV